MKNRILLFFFLVGLICFPHSSFSQTAVRGVVTPEEFGAKGNGTHDDTRAIQQAIDQLVKLGGGIVRLGSGTYLVKSIKIGPKVSLVGNGNGATVIKQAGGQKEHCLIVKDIAAALEISNLTVLGDNVNSGIFFEESGGFGENQHYLYSNTTQWNKSQAYKWITIENICVYKFETGLDINKRGFNININNSTFSYNGTGVAMKCSDSFIYNCYVANNSKNGLVVSGGANKIDNIKSIFNGRANSEEYGAIVIRSSSCQISNCETQDNYGKGFIVEGMYNLISNCISNTDGYSRDPFGYDPTVEACGFFIKGLYNSFSNCAVKNYNEKYGAVYHSPIIVDEAVSYYYPDILDKIKVLIAPNRLMFNEPFRNVQTLASKNHVENLNVQSNNEGAYFVSKSQNSNVIRIDNLNLGSLQMIVDFRSNGDGGRLLEIDGANTLSIHVVGRAVILFWKGKKEAELVLDNDAVLNKDDLRLMVSFSRYGKKKYVELLMYEKTEKRGWIKKKLRKENGIPADRITKATLMIGGRQLPIKRLVVTQTPMVESVVMPSSNLNKIYESAVIYLDADSM